ncbi:UV radiation resistance protein and autophagy-related subunit 14-domain-containing protein [Dichotomopilus funicola]|uniref:Autophagy-related protein 14 n=1 Tax=Dichotomopilus funicola TaxID=1934379 RepID=A0AAN6ZJS7_9PEZI|nr:UV radiation resistance protein and autophagy-related subunit 14-domain-containing protein [Dichotomopilus funicola]
MNCSICHRPHSASKRPFLCAVDARNCVYEARIEYVKALMESEAAERQVDAVATTPTSEKKRDRQTKEEEIMASRARLDHLRSMESASRDRTAQIISQADRLQAEVESARAAIAEKNARLARRRTELASVSAGTGPRRTRQLGEAEMGLQRLRYKWNRCADSVAETRGFLCEGAARLYGLRQVRKGAGGGSGGGSGGGGKRYEIGGVEIFDLHAMNSLSPEVISTALSHIAHLLSLAARYLGIRLPAEITPPHADYPRPTIFSLTWSYRHGEVAFPGSLASQIPTIIEDGETGRDRTRKSDKPGRQAHEHTPRPRPLFLDKPLPTLAKEDPAGYKLFLEGVSLLAYDVAWACCSQGVSVGGSGTGAGDKDSYEDVCNIGQNLWRLLIGDQLHRRSVEPTFRASLTPSGGSPKESGTMTSNTPKPTIGRWSHGTLHSFLSSAEGTDFVRSFPILPPLKLADRLKKRLLSETPLLEWETIEGDEVDEGYGVLNGGGGGAGANSGGASGGGNGGKGTSGWTRLKSR